MGLVMIAWDSFVGFLKFRPQFAVNQRLSKFLEEWIWLKNWNSTWAWHSSGVWEIVLKYFAVERMRASRMTRLWIGSIGRAWAYTHVNKHVYKQTRMHTYPIIALFYFDKQLKSHKTISFLVSLWRWILRICCCRCCLIEPVPGADVGRWETKWRVFVSCIALIIEEACFSNQQSEYCRELTSGESKSKQTLYI